MLELTTTPEINEINDLILDHRWQNVSIFDHMETSMGHDACKLKKLQKSPDFVMYSPERYKFFLDNGMPLLNMPEIKKIKPSVFNMGRYHKVFIDFKSQDLYYESDIEPYYCHIPKYHQALRELIIIENLVPLCFNSHDNSIFYHSNETDKIIL